MGKEETYPRASPLTFTGVTNGPKNRGKGKEKEMKGEKGSERCHEPAQWGVHPKGSKSFREARAPS